MIVFSDKKERIVLDDKTLAAGGEGEVHKVTSCPARFTNVCAKLYFKPKQTKELERKIRFMVDNPPNTIVGKGMMLAWPLTTIYAKEGNFLGFLMPMAFPDSKKLVILTTPKLSEKYKQEWYKFDKVLDIKTALVSRMKLINNIAIPVHLLHETGKYVLKDFKPDNVLVTPQGKVTIVDMDSIQICDNGRLLFPGTAATENYMPPEFYNNKVGCDPKVALEASWDNFAVGEVFYQLLFGLSPYAVTPKVDTDDSHTVPYCISHNLFPFGRNASKILQVPAPHNNFNIIPKPVKELFIRAFGDRPADRPQAMEWGRTINAVLRSVPQTPAPTPPSPSKPKPNPTSNSRSTFSSSTYSSNTSTSTSTSRSTSTSTSTSSSSQPNPPKSRKHCPHCGAFVSSEGRYCRTCGFDLLAGKMPPDNIDDGKKKGRRVIWVMIIIVLIIILLAAMAG